MLTPEEVATILKVQRKTVIMWLQEKRIPGFKLGENAAAEWRIDYQDLEKYLSEQRIGEANMDLITPDEAAVILKIKRQTVLRWLKLGKLPGVKLGKGPAASWRINAEDLDQFLAALKNKWISA
ncbi:MAG: helix-turn-helix domain-containing protein [Negativicutes bacterium]|nr:helix-turn-helix domain-containing protein [Negativicutes bacterium]